MLTSLAQSYAMINCLGSGLWTMLLGSIYLRSMALFQYFNAPKRSLFLSTNVAPKSSRASMRSLCLVCRGNNIILKGFKRSQQYPQTHIYVDICSIVNERNLDLLMHG